VATFVDTNVWVYAYDYGSTEKQQVAADLIGSRAEDWVISTQVLSEFFWTVTRKLRPPLSPSDAKEATRLLATLPVVTLDGALVVSAIETTETHSIALWDAMIVEAAIRAGCDEILTEDLNDGEVIRGVKITDPFA
jgi:predicted nucleic acid-binding protein